MTDIELLKYPVGRFEKPENITKPILDQAISEIGSFPNLLKSTVQNLSDAQLDTPYRAGGWTVRELVHHCSDSHMNAFIRFKLALTEENPTIKAYHEADWAKLPDSALPIRFSFEILLGVHYKWNYLLEKMSAKDFDRTYYHPESKNTVSLKEATLMYSWHCRHHLAHIQSIISEKTEEPINKS